MSTSREQTALGPSWDECMELLDQLPGLPLDSRAEVIERLVRNPSPGIRGRALRMGAAILSDDRLVEYLRKDDDSVLRNTGLAMIQMRGSRGFRLAIELLKDRDEEVVLQAVLALGHFKDPRALEPLRAALDYPNQNVVQMTIVAIGHLGDARAIPDLLRFLKADPWLQMAAVQSLGDLRSPAAVRPLARILTDMMIGPMAAEGLARIGGAQAFRALAKHWLRFREDLDSEATLGLLAHILEGMARTPRNVIGLREALADVLGSDSPVARTAAARCVLALGPGPEDVRALTIVAETQSDHSVLPACLNRRRDLIGYLLTQQGILAAWAFLLSARFPKDVPVATFVETLGNVALLESLDSIAKALEKIRGPEVGEGLLSLYVRLPLEYRASLTPLIAIHKRHLRSALKRRPAADRKVSLILSALLGSPATEVAASIIELSHEDRVEVLPQISERRDLLSLLPWTDWLKERPDLYSGIAAEAAIKAGLRELLPPLRHLLKKSPTPTLVRTVGELRDRESVPILLGLLEEDSSALDLLLLESLGRVGGPEARETLRDATASKEAKRARIAYQALSLCATKEEDAFFRAAVDHPDWYVRLSCVEVLGRFVRPENMAALAQLAADPVPIVSQRALSFLDA